MLTTFKKIILLGFGIIIFPFFAQAQTQINDSLSIQDLVDDFFNSGVLVSISNITFNGMPADSTNLQIGLFSNGSADSLNMDLGMVMSSGAVSNIVDDAFYPFLADYNDPDLEIIAGAPVHNCAVLEFDVEVNADALAFSYFFGSQEYASFTCSAYNDAFGLFISGPGIDGTFSNNAKNIATIPDSDTPVAINTVNSGIASSPGNESVCEAANPNWQADSQYFIENSSNEVSSIHFNGFTQNFEAYTEVENGETYHIKFAVCNTIDGAFNSGVFFEAGSFEGRLLTGIDETQKPEFELYPNPATDKVYLKNACSACNGESDIRITDIQGRDVMTTSTTYSRFITLDVSSLDRGIYFVSVLTGNNMVETKKLVIR